ncbi:MAG: hypothetical protein K2F86_02660, partial [Duncaniella sp.]|nr:hypothetical protein [Duncaniella sp.]
TELRMKIEKFLAMLMSAMVMMLCFSACDDKDEPKPEPDPNEVAAPNFGGRNENLIKDFRKGDFFKVFEYQGVYKHLNEQRGNLMQVTREEKWYFYPADQEEADKKRGYAHNGYLYNEYWEWAARDNRVSRDLFKGWKLYCEKKFGTVCNQYVYTGFNGHVDNMQYSLYGTEVSEITSFNDTQFVLKSEQGDYQDYFAYSFTGQTYDESNSRFYGSVFAGAENMLREMYEYYGSASIMLETGDYYPTDVEHNYLGSGTIGYVAKLLGITL